MRIGVIGLGSIGERHVKNIQSLYPDVGIDILTKRRSWSEAGAHTTLVSTPRTFYATKHDVYFITNETGKHAHTIMHCLAQKPRGIFVEKPLSHNASDIPRLRAALEKNPTVFFVAYCMQFSKPLRTMKKIVEKGTLGSIRFMRVSAGQHLSLWRSGNYKNHYSADARRGGGVTLDLIHELNYPAWILGESLTFITGFSRKGWLSINAEDMSEGVFRTRSGIVVSTHQDYLHIPGARSCEIAGSKAALTWDGAGTIRIQSKSRSRVVRVSEDRNEMYKRELMWFISLVRKGTRYSNFEEAAHDVNNALQLKNI